MKTRNILWSFLAMFLLVSVSCSKDDDDTQDVTAGFSASKTTALVGEAIQFTNNSLNASAYVWSFGDGTTSTEKSPSKTYNTSDIFEVTLSATGAGGTKTSKSTIYVVPSASFSVDNEGSLQAGTPVVFKSTSLGATTYEWTFGDAANSKSGEANPTFTYSAAGDYNVSLKATGKGGSSTVTKSITVKGAAPARELYYIEYGVEKIKRLSLAPGSSPEDFLDIAGKGGVGLAFDSKSNTIYFSDFENEDQGKIWRINADGSGLKEIATGITDPYNIALNTDEGKLYWADDAGNISRANLDGSNPEKTFIHVDDGQMRGLSYDAVNKKLYFYEVNNEDLYVANADGTNVKVLIAGIYGYGIFVDSVNGKIYFDERNETALKSANLDGTGIKVIATTAKTRIHGIDIDYKSNKLYWSDRDGKEIKRSDLDGSNAESVITGLDSPRGIFIK